MKQFLPWLMPSRTSERKKNLIFSYPTEFWMMKVKNIFHINAVAHLFAILGAFIPVSDHIRRQLLIATFVFQMGLKNLHQKCYAGLLLLHSKVSYHTITVHEKYLTTIVHGKLLSNSSDLNIWVLGKWLELNH